MRSESFNCTHILGTLEDSCRFPPESSLIPDKCPPQDQYPSLPHEVGFPGLIPSRTTFYEGALVNHHLNRSSDREGRPDMHKRELHSGNHRA